MIHVICPLSLVSESHPTRYLHTTNQPQHATGCFGSGNTLLLWEHQNRFKYGSDRPDQQQLKEQLQEEIEAEYDQGLDNLLTYHHWLDKLLLDML